MFRRSPYLNFVSEILRAIRTTGNRLIGFWKQSLQDSCFGVYKLRRHDDENNGGEVSEAIPKASVDVSRKGLEARIEISEFDSPSMNAKLKPLESRKELLSADFRKLISSVFVDNDNNGNVFNITFADIPWSKNDMIAGSYRISLPRTESTIAVKIVGLLGEEVTIYSRPDTLKHTSRCKSE